MKQVTILQGQVTGKPVQINPDEIVIPDLWHVGIALRDLAKRSAERGLKSEAIQWQHASEAVLETWHKAHDMKRALIDAPDPPPAKKKVAKAPKVASQPTTAVETISQ